MRILFLINDINYFVSHRLDLALSFKEKGFIPIIALGRQASLQMDNYDYRKNDLNKLNIHHLNFRSANSNIFLFIRDLIQLAILIKKEKPESLYLVSSKPIILGGIISKFFSFQSVIYAVSGMGYFFTERNSFSKKFSSLLFVNCLKFIINKRKGKIIVQNNDDYIFFKNKFHLSSKSLYLVKGSGVDLYKNYYNKKLKKNIILFPARILLHKGIIEFIKAAEMLSTTYKNWEFLIAGATEYDSPISINQKNINDLISSKNIRFIGYQNNLSKLMNASKIVCLPSYREGMPKSLNEAAASGCAIITTDVPGCRESIQDNYNGYLCDVKNYKSLADKLEKLFLNHDILEKFSKNSRKYAEENFNLNIINDNIIKIYKDKM